MATQVGVGTSVQRNTRLAAQEALASALHSAAVERADLVLVYFNIGHDALLLSKTLRAETAGADLVGCSVSGCIGRGFADESSYCIEVLVIASDELKFHTASVPDIASDPGAAGRTLGTALRPHVGPDASAMLFYADAFTLNYSAIKDGIDAELGTSQFLPFLGGGANNDVTSMQTFQLHNDAVYEKGGVCTLIRGAHEVVAMATHGCTPIGMVQQVTRSSGNVIQELDGKLSLEVIKTFITAEEDENWLTAVGNLCLGLELPEAVRGEYDKLCIRYMVGRDPVAGSITIQTETPPGTRILLARRDAERMAADTTRVATALLARLAGRTPKLLLHFECTGRGKLFLRDQVRIDLLQRLQSCVPATVPWFGAYVGGEIAPIGDVNLFHNYTAVVVALL
ncbi:MAG TPA: FIST N-terminal domain-containing protein [Pseudomonadota bacterium]|nr:FIST N-terminal domain-containing protein [Pseudomonadota bacterium]